MKRWRIVFLAVFAMSCAAQTKRPSSPAVTASEPDLSYVLQLRRAPSPVVSVEVTVHVSGSPVVLGCNEWGGIEHCENEIGDLHAHNSDHQPLPTRHSANQWFIDAPLGSKIRVSYVLTPSKRDAMASEETRYYPVVTDRYMHFIGDIALLIPREPKGLESRQRSIDLHWRGFVEAGWKVACSFGLDNDVSVRRSTGDFAHAVFVAGDYEIFHTQDPSGDVILAIRPGSWKFGPLDILATALPVIKEERSIFRAKSEAPLLITATPMAVDADAIDGTMLVNSIALFLPRPGRLLPAPFIGLLIGHEYFHDWDITDMQPDEAEGAGIMWFTEGFAEFYMRRAAYRAGRITRTDYLWHLNRALLNYTKSSVRDAPNERIRSDFWRTPDMNRLPYNRGQLVAILIDAMLRSTSGGSRSLDDLVRTLYEDVRATKRGVTTESILHAIETMTTRTFGAQIGRIVIDGEIVSLPPDVFGPCVTLKQATVEVGEAESRHVITAPQFEFTPNGQSTCAGLL